MGEELSPASIQMLGKMRDELGKCKTCISNGELNVLEREGLLSILHQMATSMGSVKYKPGGMLTVSDMAAGSIPNNLIEHLHNIRESRQPVDRQLARSLIEEAETCIESFYDMR